jgi:hypothetical protein
MRSIRCSIRGVPFGQDKPRKKNGDASRKLNEVSYLWRHFSIAMVAGENDSTTALLSKRCVKRPHFSPIFHPFSTIFHPDRS